MSLFLKILLTGLQNLGCYAAHRLHQRRPCISPLSLAAHLHQPLHLAEREVSVFNLLEFYSYALK